ncbi:hypothetical protein HA402_001452 [Bradysia odoriphaga]|nr:hypothetical protein HA402_001426 [Bradysia odoriphaga]KAG4071015.1 hypothetical protein HA402_001452 [Bradysia odoriphaga]
MCHVKELNAFSVPLNIDMGSTKKTIDSEETLLPNSSPSMGNSRESDSIKSEEQSPATPAIVESDNATSGFPIESAEENTFPTTSGASGPTSFVDVLQEMPSTSAAPDHLTASFNSIVQTFSSLSRENRMALKRKVVQFLAEDETQEKLIRLTLSDI